MKNAAVILDFDGVIIDSESHWPTVNANVIAPLLSRQRWSVEDDRSLIGQSMENVHTLLVRDHGLTMELPAYERLVWDNAAHIYESLAEPMPGVTEFLERVTRSSIALAIASSNERTMIEASINRLGLQSYFPIIRSKNDVPGRTKPFPDVYLQAADGLGVEPARCIAVEDSHAGVTAAKEAGMTCVALHSAHNNKQDLSAADDHIDHFDELSDERVALLLR